MINYRNKELYGITRTSHMHDPGEVHETFYSSLHPPPPFNVGQVDKLTVGYLRLTGVPFRLGPISDAVIHISRIELAKSSSCEVRLLNQFGTAD